KDHSREPKYSYVGVKIPDRRLVPPHASPTRARARDERETIGRNPSTCNARPGEPLHRKVSLRGRSNSAPLTQSKVRAAHVSLFSCHAGQFIPKILVTHILFLVSTELLNS